MTEASAETSCNISSKKSASQTFNSNEGSTEVWWVGAQNQGRIQDTRSIEGVIRDGNNYLGSIGIRSFQLVGCRLVLKLIAGCGINKAGSG